jgi:hypothetical protein
MERIEFAQGFADAEGNNKARAELGLPSGIPNEVRHVVTLSAVDNATTALTVREFGYPSLQTVEISQAGMENASTRWRPVSRAPPDATPCGRYVERLPG